MVIVEYVVNDRSTNESFSGTIEKRFHDGLTVGEAATQILKRIEDAFVFDSINGLHAIDIRFTVHFPEHEEVDTFSRYYSNRRHIETV